MKNIAVIGVLMLAIMTASVSYAKNNSRAYNKRHQDTVERIVENYTIMVSYGVMNDKNPVQLKVCENLLNECVKKGVLNWFGKQAYKKLKKHKSVAEYMELIDECMEEDEFDRVSDDLLTDYQMYVLDPRTDKD